MTDRIPKPLVSVVLAAAMVLLMVFNYMTNAFDKNNDRFETFSSGSESLVTAAMIAHTKGYGDSYGIGYYETAVGEAQKKQKGYDYYLALCGGLTDENFENGYSRTQPGCFALAFNGLGNNVYEYGKKVKFADQSVYDISQVTYDGNCFYVQLDCPQLLSLQQNGSLADIQVLDGDGNIVQTDRYISYISHCGLQGKVMSAFTRFLPPEKVFVFCNIVCCALLAIVLAAICFMLRKKYNTLMAACFYAVFLLAPIVVNFARNLYWVEFTWFVPMAAGLFCSTYFENKNARIAAYAAAFVSVMIKSLCGYEYISAILVAMMAFLFADFVCAALKKDISLSLRLFKSMCIMGAAAVVGFAAAIVIHASIRGGGSIAAGIADIWHNDVLRRTIGGNAADYSENWAQSINASFGEVLRLYIHPENDIIAGVSKNLFKYFMFSPVVAAAYDLIRHKKTDIKEYVLCIVTLAAALSWFILAKSHSYEHTHLNLVVWYFGFVQMCFYLPLSRVLDLVKSLLPKIHMQKN